jgi:hypothetical protein
VPTDWHPPPTAELTRRTSLVDKPAPLSAIDVGNIKITYLPDGDAQVSPTVVFPASNDANEDSKLVLSLGGFLIQTGDQNVIVDLGVGRVTVPVSPTGDFQGGCFLDSLRQAGVEPADVDVVLFTLAFRPCRVDRPAWITDLSPRPLSGWSGRVGLLARCNQSEPGLGGA